MKILDRVKRLNRYQLGTIFFSGSTAGFGAISLDVFMANPDPQIHALTVGGTAISAGLAVLFEYLGILGDDNDGVNIEDEICREEFNKGVYAALGLIENGYDPDQIDPSEISSNYPNAGRIEDCFERGVRSVVASVSEVYLYEVPPQAREDSRTGQ